MRNLLFGKLLTNFSVKGEYYGKGFGSDSSRIKGTC